MRWKSVLGLVAVLPLGAGCNLAYYAGHNLVNEPVTRADEHRLSGRLRAEGRVAWRSVRAEHPARNFTPEFADGFADGYADQLESGGPAAPPAVPPLRYRRADYLTAQGQTLIRDYMLGAQYGAEVAAMSGRRQSLTVPVLLSTPVPDAPLQVVQFTEPPAASLDPPGTVKSRPTPPDTTRHFGLPAPRPLVPAPEPPRLDPPRVEVPVAPPPADPAVMPVVAVEVVPEGPSEPAPEVDLPGGVMPPSHQPPPAAPPAPLPPSE